MVSPYTFLSFESYKARLWIVPKKGHRGPHGDLVDVNMNSFFLLIKDHGRKFM